MSDNEALSSMSAILHEKKVGRTSARPSLNFEAEMTKLEYVRNEAQQLLAEGAVKRYPLLLTVFAIRIMFSRLGVAQPEDVLAFVTKGEINMSMVDDWNSPYGC
ncbi:hypothetical protein AX761_22195 [Rhizobium sp. 58]|nr:hypothetical protein AX761_22195 [Rhizobium sp. 58]